MSENQYPSTTTKKRQSLTFPQKVEIIRQLDNGHKQQELANLYGVGRSTIAKILKMKTVILDRNQLLLHKHPKKQSKRFSAAEGSLMETILYSWFCQNREAGIAISGPLLQENALKINENLFGKTTFTASSGWLQKFKARFNIRHIGIHGEKLVADSDGAAQFCREIQTFIREENIKFSHIYNADETGLNWKQLPKKTMASRCEKNVAGFKVAKDRVTLINCANASGDHKIPLLMVGKFASPSYFEGLEVLPINYTHQKNSLMDKSTFMLWFTNIFLPTIKDRMLDPNEKFLLLLDNAPSHPSAEELNAVDSCCIVKFLPPNVTSLIQPMVQGVIVAMKRHYKKSYLREFFIQQESTEINANYLNFVKKWNLVDCMKSLSVAWNSVTKDTLHHAWKNLLDIQSNCDEENSVHEIMELASHAMQVPLSAEEITEWLDSDIRDPGWKVQTIEEVTAEMRDDQMDNEDEETGDGLETENNENCDEAGDTKEPAQVSAIEAYEGARNLYKWLMTRWDITSDNLLEIGSMAEYVAAVMTEDKLAKSRFN